MAARRSSGILLFRRVDSGVEVLIAHPGGPFWAHRDVGACSIPKGEYGDEDPARAAAREFGEELGIDVPPGPWIDLGEIVQKAGKRVRAWAVEGDLDADAAVSATIEIEWPPRSGRRLTVPEVDRVAWMSPEMARRRLNPAQIDFIDRLLSQID